MTKRVCAQPGCPILGDTARCKTHERARDRARGTRQDRGYDAKYDALRKTWQQRLDGGIIVICWRCKELGQPHRVDPADWHLGHDLTDRSIIRGPQCSTSNLRDAGTSRR